jgi:hypothetical protein
MFLLKMRGIRPGQKPKNEIAKSIPTMALFSGNFRIKRQKLLLAVSVTPLQFLPQRG